VGRWDNYSKNTPLLMRSLDKTLSEFPDYEAHIFGGGEECLEKLKMVLCDDVKRRIFIRGKVSNAELTAEYQKSRIFFAPSRSESFNIAAAEALSSGCSFVGSGHIFSFRNFVSKNSGTLARHYSIKGMTEALASEIFAWEEGLRDPVKTAALWKEEVSRVSVAKEIIAVCAEPRRRV
jgi:glycosyltransferase involved in cell wall biosynthesis